MRRWLGWFFRDSDTGRVTVVQMPNAPLAIFLVASVLLRFTDLAGTWRTIGSVIATGALLWWAADEVLRGSSPFRRVLGLVVVIATVAQLLRALSM